MIPDAFNISNKNTSLDILDGVTLNITEMNIAGSIPLEALRNNSPDGVNRWFNWTASIYDDPGQGKDDHKEFKDKLLNVTLPKNPKNVTLNKSNSTNTNTTNSTAGSKSKSSSLA